MQGNLDISQMVVSLKIVAENSVNYIENNSEKYN